MRHRSAAELVEEEVDVVEEVRADFAAIVDDLLVLESVVLQLEDQCLPDPCLRRRRCHWE